MNRFHPARLLHRFRRQEPIRKGRRIPVAQIEITSRCGLDCAFCAQEALGERWLSGDLSLDSFRNFIEPHLSEIELIYLQGWGEPLLHPDLWEMLALARGYDCQTGFTTSGALLKDRQRRRILDSGLDILSISFSGATAELHQSLRAHSDWHQLCRQVEQLAELRRKGDYRLRIGLHFLMTCTNWVELPAFVRLAARLGADEVVATNLTYTPTRRLDELKAFGEIILEEQQAVLEEACRFARETGLRLHIYPLQMNHQTLECDARPQETIFINHRGEVTPCVYLGLSVAGEIPRFFLGESRPTQPVSFGNVRSGLMEALNSPAREAFVRRFRERAAVTRDPLAGFTWLAGNPEPALPPPPEPCRSCYKMFGV